MLKNLKSLLPNSRYLVVSFFIIFFLIGISIIDDYGISYDEVDYRHQGGIILNYIAEKLFPDFIVDSIVKGKDYLPLLENKNMFLNGSTFFHTFAGIVEFILQVTTSKEQFLLKHYLTFFVSFIGLIYFYFLLKKRFLDWKLSLFGVLCLILSPKVFAEFFYSPNDIVFAFFLVILSFHSLNFLSHTSYKNALICGLLSAATMAIRIIGIYVPFFIVAFLIVIFFNQENKNEIWKKYLNSTILYILITIIFYTIFSPPMWERPISYITSILSSATDHRNIIIEVLFNGKIYLSTELPWYYLIYWIGVSTPILYLFLFFLGFLKVIFSIYTKKIFFWKNRFELQDYYCLGLMLAPILGTLIFNSNMWNGWRHLYFIYPFLIYISVIGLNFFLNLIKKKLLLSKLLIVLIIFNFLLLIMWTIKNHPYQNVFFNSFAKDPQKNMELDYYGLSNREALNHILKIDNREKITVFGIGRTYLVISLQMLEDNQKERLNILHCKKRRFSRKVGYSRDFFDIRPVCVINADYIIANQNLDRYKNYLLNKNLSIIYEIKVDEVTINSIFKKN